MSSIRLPILACVALSAVTLAAAQTPPAGLAAKYPGDAGLAKDPDVIFSDDFENWSADGLTPPAGTWDGVSKKPISRVLTVPGQVAPAGPGARVLEISAWQTGQGEGSGGAHRRLGNYNSPNDGRGPGYDEVYVRYYLKLDDKYKAVANHGANLGGRDVTQQGARWVGMANTTDIARDGYFYSGLQPRGTQGRADDIHLGFYSYHMDKRGAWGAEYPYIQKKTILPGKWYCVERHMKLNSTDPLAADGIEELWVDGELCVRQEGLRFRKVPQLKISFFSMEAYYHNLPPEFDAANPIRFCVDNLVIAKKYVGPIAEKK